MSGPRRRPADRRSPLPPAAIVRVGREPALVAGAANESVRFHIQDVGADLCCGVVSWSPFHGPVITTRTAAHIARMSPKQKKAAIIAAAAAVVILIIIGIASCSTSSRPEASAAPAGSFSGGVSTPYASGACVPPLACGPTYANYVPPYYQAHPSFIYLTPYSAFYTPLFNGRSYTATRTPAGKAPVTTRTPMPYPPGYKPVPGDFQPPTAPAKATPAAPRPTVPAPVKSPADTTSKYTPPPAPKYTAPKNTPPKYTAPKSTTRK